MFDRFPVLSGRGVTLREICESDAAPLYWATASPELREFTKAPPSSVEGFERFIARSRGKRAAGRGGVFAIIPAGDTSPVGLFQLNVFEEESGVVEWGFVLAVSLWGKGIFVESATLVLDFLFGEVAAERVQGGVRSRIAARYRRSKNWVRFRARSCTTTLTSIVRATANCGQSLLRRGEIGG